MADSQRKTANLFDILSPEQSRWSTAKIAYGVYYVADFAGVTAANRYRLSTVAGKTYTISGSIDNNAITVQLSNYLDGTTYPVEGDIRLSGNFNRTFTAQGQTTLSIFAREANQSATITDLIVYEGTTTIPYEDYGWLHSLRELKTATETIQSGDTIYADGTAATVSLKGNEQHTGTPSPQNPIAINGVGDKTANLYNLNAVDTAKGYVENYRLNGGNPDVAVGNFITEYIAVIPDSTYTISGFTAGWASSVVWYDSTFAKIGYQLYENKSINTFTVPSNAKYVRFTGDMKKKDITMFNLGSTAKLYEPYGYKIPISNGQQTTTIYLGSTQTVRQIKKLVFTGNEQFTNEQIEGGYRATFDLQDYIKADTKSLSLCSHFPYQSNWTVVPGFVPNSVLNALFFMSLYSDFAAYCAQQYANGTPVTVWYVPVNPQTAAVNEPLMKIGDYADTLSNAASIPTTEGANSITVDTTVQPSEFTATWTGWHDSSVKEWDGSQWN